MTISLQGNTISFAFDAPIRDTGYLAETFDLDKKRAYATLGIQELIHSKNDIVLQKTKSVREMHGYSGFSTSIRIAKGFSYRIGTVKPITSTKTVQYTDDIGQFLITNQRVGFIGAKQNFLIPIDKLIQFQASGDGLFLMKENTTKLHHIVLTDYDIPLLVLERLYTEIKEPVKQENIKVVDSATETKALPEKRQDKTNSDYMDEIAKLGKLKDDGLITEEEFTEKKKKILGI